MAQPTRKCIACHHETEHRIGSYVILRRKYYECPDCRKVLTLPAAEHSDDENRSIIRMHGGIHKFEKETVDGTQPLMSLVGGRPSYMELLDESEEFLNSEYLNEDRFTDLEV